MKNKIAIIFPYFGAWPDWFELTLYTMKVNNFIDFHFYTDCSIPQNRANNIFFHKISFKEYCDFVSDKLKINFYPQSAYKLCDLKPFYGFIHKDELVNYHFWGFGDIDLIYGDLRSFITDDMLNKYDLITTHADRIAGHFTIIRNNSKYSYLCLKIKNWKQLLLEKNGKGLDEHHFTELVWPSQRYIWMMFRIIRRISKIHYFSFFEPFNNILCSFSKCYIAELYTSPLPADGEIWKYYLSNNKIISPRNNREIPYLHFLFFKKTPFINTSHHWKNDFFLLSKTELDNILKKKTGVIFINNLNIIYHENE